jgi:hypothetical protein
MKAQTSGLLWVLLGVTVLSACRDPINDGSGAVSVDIVPDTATLVMTPPGNTRQFTAVVNGAANQAVTWRSSVVTVATVSPSGLVTAVGVGQTQIIAQSVADTTKRAAAAVNVVSIGPTITIARVTQGGTNMPVNTSNVRGQIDVIADFQRQSAPTVSRVEFLLDNQVLDGQSGRPNCTQTFSSGGSADNEVDEDAEEIVCSINTAAFVEATGAPAFPNGSHTVSARAVQTSGNTVATSNMALTFNNPNFINAAVTFVPPAGRPACVNAGSSARSIGGPNSLWCTGDVRVALTPINYGDASQAIASATVNLRTSGDGVTWQDGVCRTLNTRDNNPTVAEDDDGGGPGTGRGGGAFPGCPAITKAATDNNAADGLAVTFSSAATGASGVQFIEDVITFTVNTVTVGGPAGPVCINPVPTQNPIASCGTGAGNSSDPNELFSVTPFRLDNLAPRVLTFDAVPDNCTSPPCWLNGAFTFTARPGFYASADYGVDHQNAATFFEAGASVNALTTAASTAALNNTATRGELFLRVSARDSLGNTALFFPTPIATIVTPNPDNALRFGVDKAPPIFLAGSTIPPNNSANVDSPAFNLTVVDTASSPAAPSGVSTAVTGPTAPIVVRVEQITAAGTVCLDPDATTATTIDCDTGGNQGNGTEAVGSGVTFNYGNPAVSAYYRVTYWARDLAGNVSSNNVITLLRDTQAPTLGGVTSPSIITGNASAAFSVEASDNIELGDVASYIQYGPTTASPLFIQDLPAPTGVGTYGPDTFTTSGAATGTFPNFMRSIQEGVGGTIKRATSITLNVRDAAGMATNNVCPTTAAPATPTTNCRAIRENITTAVNEGIPGTGANAETPFTGFTFTTNAPSETAVCNGTGTGSGQPCPAEPITTTLTASAAGPSPAFSNPFARVNIYYSGPGTNGRTVLIGTAASTATQDNGTTRTFNWSINWTPAGLAPGAYTVFAIGVDSKGQGLLQNTQTVTVTID